MHQSLVSRYRFAAASYSVPEGLGFAKGWLTAGMGLGEVEGAGVGVPRRETLGWVRSDADFLITVVESRCIGRTGEPDGAAIGIGTDEAAGARRSAPDGLGLGEAGPALGTRLGEFGVMARGAEVGDDEPLIETGGDRMALKRPKPSKQTAAPIPITTSSRHRFLRFTRVFFDKS